MPARKNKTQASVTIKLTKAQYNTLDSIALIDGQTAYNKNIRVTRQVRKMLKEAIEAYVRVLNHNPAGKLIRPSNEEELVARGDLLSHEYHRQLRDDLLGVTPKGEKPKMGY